MSLEVSAFFMLDVAESGWNPINSSGCHWKSVPFLCWRLLEVGGIQLEVCAIFVLDMAGSGGNLENSGGYTVGSQCRFRVG